MVAQNDTNDIFIRIGVHLFMTFVSLINQRKLSLDDHSMLRSPWLFGFLAILPFPALFFSSALPAWAPVIALIYLTLLLFLRNRTTDRWLCNTPADLLLLGMLLILPLGLWASADASITLPRTYAMLGNFTLFVILAAQSKNRHLPHAGWGLLVMALLLIVVTLPGTKLTGTKFPIIDKGLLTLIPHGLRLPGDKNGFNPNMTAGLLAPFAPIAIMLAVKPTRRSQQILAIFTTLLLLVAILLTQSRGALLAAVIAIAVVTSIGHRFWRWAWLALSLPAIAFLIVNGQAFLNALIKSGNTSSSVNTLEARQVLWQRTLLMAHDLPFTGVGLGMFQPVMKAMYPPLSFSATTDIPHPHNIFLQALAEMGYPGLILFVAFYLILAYVLIRQIRRHRDWPQTLSIGLLGALITYLIHGLVDVPTYSLLSAVIFWFLFGSMMAVGLYEDAPSSSTYKNNT